MMNQNDSDFTSVVISIDAEDAAPEGTAGSVSPKTLEELHAEHPDDIPLGLRCAIRPLNMQKELKYVVVCSFFGDKIVLSRHRKRHTWETQGGHIEPGETPLEAARRELFEESGISDAALIPVCDYTGYVEERHADGRVFAAVVHELGHLPVSEMGEVRLFARLPAEDDLTYPNVTPKLFTEARTVLARMAAQDKE